MPTAIAVPGAKGTRACYFVGVGNSLPGYPAAARPGISATSFPRKADPLTAPIDYFNSDTLRQDLKGKTVRGGLYVAAAQATQIAIQLGTIPILARLLQPSDFGLVAMVVVLSAFAGMFVDAGLSLATVQRANITHAQVSNLFWVSTALGGLVAAVFALLSPVIAWFYDEPRLVAITLALCASFVFAGLTMQHQALLRRVMRFRALTIIQVASGICGAAAGIAWAWFFRNYWALVLMPLTTAFARMLGTWAVCRWRPGLPRRGTGVWQMLVFGGYLTGFNFVNYFARHADAVLIGWYWGAAPLGFYERAYKLLMFPLTQINAPLMNVTIPALSRTLDEPAKYRNAFLRTLESLLLVTTPLMAFVLVTRDLCIHVLLGPQWGEAVPIFGWLGIAGLFQPFMSSLGWLLVSQGRTREMFRWSLFSTAVCVAAFSLGLRWGPVGVAAAYVIASAFIQTPSYIYCATRSGPVRARDLLPITALPAALAAAVFAGVSLVRLVLGTGSNVLDLIVCFAAAAGIWFFSLVATAPGQRRIVYFRNSLRGKQAGS
jgi:PST family polysaccharide transporter